MLLLILIDEDVADEAAVTAGIDDVIGDVVEVEVNIL